MVLDNLPTVTKARMSGMTSPALIGFKGSEEDILSSNLVLKYPQWITDVRSDLLSGGCFHFLVDANSLYSIDFRTLDSVLGDGEDPLDAFHRGDSNAKYDSYTDLGFTLQPRLQQPFDFEAVDSFRSLREYLTVLNAASGLNRAKEVRQIKAYEAGRKRLILVNCVQQHQLLCYYGLITTPTGDQYSLQAGDGLEVSMTDAHNAPQWRATVIESPTIHLDGMTAVLVCRGQHSISGIYDSYNPSYAINGLKLDKHQVNQAVRRSRGGSVTVKIVDCDSVHANIVRSYDALSRFHHGTETVSAAAVDVYRERIIRLLLGKRPDLLVAKDLYEPVRFAWPWYSGFEGRDALKYMSKLHERQEAVVKSSASLRGGLQIVQGPPGTGKTFLLQEMVVPFLVAWSESLVLVIAPSNHGADDHAKGLREVLERLKQRFPDLGYLSYKYILRLHSRKAEYNIARVCGPKQTPSTPVANTAAVRTPISARGPSFDPVLDGFVAASATKFDGIDDRRVQDVTYSVGNMMLQISDVLPNSLHAHVDDAKFSRFREIYVKRSKGHRLTLKEDTIWADDCKTLFQLALIGAAAIVGTTAGITATHTLPLVQDKVHAVFLEENAFEREDSLAPLFAAEFLLNPCIVAIGDQQQLAPVAKGKLSENQFKPQLEKSFMARQICVGYDYIMLNHQHRMVKDIVCLPNTLTYNNQLASAPSTALSARPLAREFLEFAQALVGKATSRIPINVSLSLEKGTIESETGSKGNDYIVCVVSGLVQDLLASHKGRAEVAVLTPYKYQLSKYDVMRGNMRKHGLQYIDKVTIDTVDGAQGRQYDIVIVDLPVNDKIGFLNNKRRLNVAMTRARDGLIVVCDKVAIVKALRRARARDDYSGYLQNLLSLFIDRTYNQPVDDSYPRTPFYTPSRGDAYLG